MTEPAIELDIAAIIQMLRRKEGTWVQWGQACLQLQKAGKNPQEIFEETGFEPVQQNQIIVAAQVYASLVAAGAIASVLEHFQARGSDILYELRVLSQLDRVAAAELVLGKNLDAIAAREVVKAVKEFAALTQMPPGFTEHPGDAVAYQAWKSAGSVQDPQERARLIARGLQFAHSAAARSAIEKLLTDMVSPPARHQPRLPLYRLSEEDNLPRLLPVVGKLPLQAVDVRAVPLVDEEPPFGIVRFAGVCAWIALPGWQVVRQVEDGVVILADTETFAEASGQQLPNSFPDRPEEIIVLCDRAQRQWDPEAYFLVERDGQIAIVCAETVPPVLVLGRVLLVMRQKRIFDEEIANEPWLLEE